MKKLLLFLFLIFSSGLAYSQGEVLDTIKYNFYLRNSTGEYGAFQNKMVEGEHFTINPLTLPPAFAAYQPLYDALVGSEMGLEAASLDRNIQMNIVLTGLDENNHLVVNGQPLFLYFEVDIEDLKTGEWYSSDSSFYFLNGKGAFLKVPVTNAFLMFCIANGINFDDGISFSYLISDDEGIQSWRSVGLTWNLDITPNPWIINLKLVHFSKFGGGGKTLATDVRTGQIVPDQFNLLQNYPNPFNPSTVIKYNLPESGNVSLKIYNALGKEISTLESGFRYSGEHTVQFNSNNLSSGTYFYTINFNGKVQTRKMLLIK